MGVERIAPGTGGRRVYLEPFPYWHCPPFLTSQSPIQQRDLCVLRPPAGGISAPCQDGLRTRPPDLCPPGACLLNPVALTHVRAVICRWDRVVVAGAPAQAEPQPEPQAGVCMHLLCVLSDVCLLAYSCLPLVCISQQKLLHVSARSALHTPISHYCCSAASCKCLYVGGTGFLREVMAEGVTCPANTCSLY